jgi:hypothetical protein
MASATSETGSDLIRFDIDTTPYTTPPDRSFVRIPTAARPPGEREERVQIV